MLLILIVSLPPVQRLTGMAAIPIVLGGVFVTAHRLLGTLLQYFTLGTSDNSISHRVNNYPYVLQMVSQRPWFGQGGGTFIADPTADLGSGPILDNQYLDTAIELGLIGVVLLGLLLLAGGDSVPGSQSRA